jgi:hypothetical protein
MKLTIQKTKKGRYSMKELTKYNRVAGYLNKLYDMLNADFFSGSMERPVITIRSTPKAYGHFSLYNAWNVKGKGVPEINIGAGTLDRPIELIATTLLHEMVHQYNAVNETPDVSRGGTYHNKRFKETAEAHGLTVSQSALYGWSKTEPADSLLEWVLENDLSDIDLNRNEFEIQLGSNGRRGRADGDDGQKVKSSYRKYICPSCELIARTTKDANIVCGDCGFPGGFFAFCDFG